MLLSESFRPSAREIQEKDLQDIQVPWFEHYNRIQPSYHRIPGCNAGFEE